MFFIREIIEENSAKDAEDITSECTELVQVKNAVDKLDGQTKTAVVLKRDEENFMVIGGGENNKYVCYAFLKGKRWNMANKFAIPREASEIIVGGKKGNYPSKKCLGLQMVLEAAKHFADRGALAQTFNWETA